MDHQQYTQVTGSRAATVQEVKDMLDRYMDMPALDHRARRPAEARIAEMKLCGNDLPNHLGRHCRSNPSRVYPGKERNSARAGSSNETRYLTGLQNLLATGSTVTFSNTDDQEVKDWLAQDQFAAFIHSYPESLEMYKKDRRFAT